MDVYCVEKTGSGWMLRKMRSVRPLAKAGTADELIDHARSRFAGQEVALRVRRENGTFQELRL